MDVAPVQVRLKAINEAAKIDDEGITDIERLTKELCNVVKDNRGEKPAIGQFFRGSLP